MLIWKILTCDPLALNRHLQLLILTLLYVIVGTVAEIITLSKFPLALLHRNVVTEGKFIDKLYHIVFANLQSLLVLVVLQFFSDVLVKSRWVEAHIILSTNLLAAAFHFKEEI